MRLGTDKKSPKRLVLSDVLSDTFIFCEGCVPSTIFVLNSSVSWKTIPSYLRDSDRPVRKSFSGIGVLLCEGVKVLFLHQFSYSFCNSASVKAPSLEMLVSPLSFCALSGSVFRFFVTREWRCHPPCGTHAIGLNFPNGTRNLSTTNWGGNMKPQLGGKVAGNPEKHPNLT